MTNKDNVYFFTTFKNHQSQSNATEDTRMTKYTRDRYATKYTRDRYAINPMRHKRHMGMIRATEDEEEEEEPEDEEKGEEEQEEEEQEVEEQEEEEQEEEEEVSTKKTLKENMREIGNNFLHTDLSDFVANKADLRHPIFPKLILKEDGQAASAPALTTLAVSGIGDNIPIPIPLPSISSLKDLATPLPPLKARETQWQIEGYNIWSATEPSFFQNTVQKQVSSYLCTHLQLDGEMLDIEARLHKMFLIGPKGNFKQFSKEDEKRKDEIEQDFGTYLLQIPVEGGHKGGDLVVKQCYHSLNIETQVTDDKLYETLLLAGSHYEIKHVESGFLCFLVFQLDYRKLRHKMSPLRQLCMMVRSSQIQSLLKLIDQFRNQIKIWETCVTMAEQPMLAFPLKEKYSPERISILSLKGRDSILVNALLTISDILNVYIIPDELHILCEYEQNIVEEEADQQNQDCEEDSADRPKKRAREEMDKEDVKEDEEEGEEKEEEEEEAEMSIDDNHHHVKRMYGVKSARKSILMNPPARKRGRYEDHSNLMVIDSDKNNGVSDRCISSSSSCSAASDDSKEKLFGETDRWTDRHWKIIQDPIVKGLHFNLSRDLVTRFRYDKIEDDEDIFDDLDYPDSVRIDGSSTYYTYYRTHVVLIPKAFSQMIELARDTDNSVRRLLSKVKFDGRSVGDMMVKISNTAEVTHDISKLYPYIPNISVGYYLPLISVAVKLHDKALAELFLDAWVKKNGTSLDKSDHVHLLYLARNWGWSVVANCCFELLWKQTFNKEEFLDFFEYVFRFKKDSQWAKNILDWILQKIFTKKATDATTEKAESMTIAVDTSHHNGSKDEKEDDGDNGNRNSSVFDNFSDSFFKKLMSICLMQYFYLKQLREEVFKEAEDFSLTFFGSSRSTKRLHGWLTTDAIKLYHASPSQVVKNIIMELVHHREEKLRAYFNNRYGPLQMNSYAIRVSEEKAIAMDNDLLEFLVSPDRKEYTVKNLGSIDNARKFAEMHLAYFARLNNKLMYSINPNGVNTFIQVIKMKQAGRVDGEQDIEINCFSPGNLLRLIEEIVSVKKQLQEPLSIDLTSELPAPIVLKEKKTAMKKKVKEAATVFTTV